MQTCGLGCNVNSTSRGKRSWNLQVNKHYCIPKTTNTQNQELDLKYLGLASEIIEEFLSFF
jgi:hypothetical protein